MLDLSKIDFKRSPNYKKGIGKIHFIVLHCPVGSYQSAINTFLNSHNQVSAHFVVSQKGEIVQMVDLANTAWHTYGYNNQAWGIEMEDKGQVERSAVWQTPALIDNTAQLVAALLKKANLTVDAVVGHNASFIQSYAKQHSPRMLHTDPGKFFNLEEFKKKVQQKLNEGQHTNV